MPDIFTTAISGPTGMTGPIAFNDLTDVSVPNPASGDVAISDGTFWNNVPLAPLVNNLVTAQISGLGLSDLVDVALTTPTAGQVLQFDGTDFTNQTLPPGGTGGASTLNDLTDVVITGTPTAGQVLLNDGVNFLNVPASSLASLLSLGLGDLDNVSLGPLGPAQDDFVLTFDNASQSFVLQPPAVPSLASLSDTVITAPVDANDVVVSDGTNFVNIPLSNLLGSASLGDLSDVVLGTTGAGTDGFVLTYDDATSSIVLQALPDTDLGDVNGVSLSNPTADDVLLFDGTDFANTPALDVVEDALANSSIDNFSDVSLGNPGAGQDGDVLTFDAVTGELVLQPLPDIPEVLNDLNDVTITGTPPTGQVLRASGGSFVNANLTTQDLSNVANTTPVNNSFYLFNSGTSSFVPRDFESEVEDALESFAGLNANGEAPVVQSGNIGSAFVVTTEQRTRNLYGIINSGGGILAGSSPGFTVTRTGVGVYRINFATSFETNAVCTASQQVPTPTAPAIASYFAVAPGTANSTIVARRVSTGGPFDTAFTFHAAGRGVA